MSPGERVHGVALLFCDLVGSTALLSRIGEAANDELRRDLFESLRQPLWSHRGRKVKSQGDGLMVAFQASAEDAVRCAIAMNRAVARLAAAADGPALAIRVGISAGEVTAENGDWFGTPVVEAARLCGLAASGQILITDHSLGEARRTMLMARSVGALAMKGFPDPVECSEVPWLPAVDGAGFAPLPPGLDISGQPAFVGGASSLGVALDSWTAAKGGASAIVLTSGPPRSGRTRHVAEVAGIALGQGAVVLYGSARRRSSPFEVFVEALRRFVLWAPQEIVEQLDTVQGLAALVPALDVRLGRTPSPAITGAGTREIVVTIEAALRIIRAAAPVLFVIEELQWLDAQTLDVIAALSTTVRVPGVMLALTCRTMDGGESEVLRRVLAQLRVVGAPEIVLGSLGDADVSALIDSIDSIVEAAVPRGRSEVITASVGSLAGDVVGAVSNLLLAANQTDGEGGEDGEDGKDGKDGGGVADDRFSARALSASVPYKGLVSHGPADSGVFFGRDGLVLDVVEQLTQRRFAAVVGSSGSGKSSLLRAGVINHVGASGRQVTVTTPSERSTFADLLAGTDRHAGLIVDQFEEFFTLWDERGRRQVFDDLFAALDFGGIEWLAIGLRSDFFGSCAEHPILAARLGSATTLVGRMSDEELRAIIEQPARAARLVLDPAVTNVILEDLADEAQPLPLLSHTMFETWRRRSADHIVLFDYHEAGGVSGSIARTAESVYSGRLDEAGQRCARDLFLRMVEPADDRPPTRRPMDRRDLQPTFGSDVGKVLETLVSARLVVVSDDRVDLAHEALLTEWPRLATWIDDGREDLRARAHLSQAAREWVDGARSDHDLYRGVRLDAAERLAESGYPLTPLEHDFLEAGARLRTNEQASLQRTNRRLRRQLVGALLALAVAAAATVAAIALQRSANAARTVADRQRRQAQIALVASTARDVGRSSVDVAALLAVEAHRLQPDGDTLGALETVLRTQPSVARVIYPAYLTSTSVLMSTSADGSKALIADGNRLVVVDTTSLNPVQTLTVEDQQATALSADGAEIAVATTHSIETYRVGDGQRIGNFAREAAATPTAPGMAWVDDTHLVLSPPAVHEARLVDARSGSTVRSFATDDVGVAAVDSARGLVAVTKALAPDAADRAVGLGVGIFDPTTGTSTFTTTAPLGVVTPPSGAVDASFSYDGAWLGVGTDVGVGLIFVPAEGSPTVIDMPAQRAVLTQASFSRDGRRMGAVDATGQVVIYGLQTPPAVTEVLRTDVVGATGGFFSPDRTSFFVSSGDHFTELALDGREPLARAPFGTSDESPFVVRPDGERIHTAGRSGIRTYDLATGDVTPAASGSTLIPQIYSADGGHLLVLDVSDNSLVMAGPDGVPIDATKRAVVNGTYSVDLRLNVIAALAADSKSLTGYDSSSMTPIGEPIALGPIDHAQIVVSNDGTLIVRSGSVGGFGHLDVLGRDGSGLSVRLTLTVPGVGSRVTAAAVAPDDREVVFGDSSGRISVVDLGTGGVSENVFSGSVGVVDALSFSTDGAELLSKTSGGTLQWWDVTTHAPIGDPVVAAVGPTGVSSADDDVFTATWDLNARFLVVPEGHGMQRWNFDFASWPSLACSRAGRNLTHAEWLRYMPDGEPYHATCAAYPSG